MSKKPKKKIKEIFGGPSTDGAASFRGGPYGIGGENQLATNINPATQAIKDQEQDEINQNVEDMHFKLGKFPNKTQGKPQNATIPQHVKDVEKAKKFDPQLNDELEENISNSFAPAPHLPGQTT